MNDSTYLDTDDRESNDTMIKSNLKEFQIGSRYRMFTREYAIALFSLECYFFRALIFSNCRLFQRIQYNSKLDYQAVDAIIRGRGNYLLVTLIRGKDIFLCVTLIRGIGRFLLVTLMRGRQTYIC